MPLTTAEKAAVLHAIAQLDGKATQKKVRRAAESILGAPEGSLDAKKAAVKEVCRKMSKPIVQSLAKLRRIGQYLYGKPSLVWRFDYQGPQTTIDIYVDANWAACRRTRKSTSGGCAMVGSHCINTWARTQLP